MGSPITEALRAAQKPVRTWLWVEADAFTFTPVVVTEAFGDGRALFRVTTIDNRPRWWVVRGCSTWQVSDYDAPDEAPEFIDQVDDILSAIEEEFGSTDCYERNRHGVWIDPETKQLLPRECTAYPVINSSGGCSWSRMDWPDLPGVTLAPHPFALGWNALALTLPPPPKEPT